MHLESWYGVETSGAEGCGLMLYIFYSSLTDEAEIEVVADIDRVQQI